VAAAQIDVRLTVPEVRVRVAPPPPRVEHQPPRTSADHVWINGHWARRGNRTVWIPGAWVRPPRPGMVWERERWNKRGRSWFFAEGHWRWPNRPAPTDVYEPPTYDNDVIATAPPPRPLAERRPPRPFPRAVWINGYWDWDGSSYVWVSGRWSARRGDAAWVPGKWERVREGRDRRWVRRPGHWRGDERFDGGRGRHGGGRDWREARELCAASLERGPMLDACARVVVSSGARTGMTASIINTCHDHFDGDAAELQCIETALSSRPNLDPAAIMACVQHMDGEHHEMECLQALRGNERDAEGLISYCTRRHEPDQAELACIRGRFR
jgi:hypothetical protein